MVLDKDFLQGAPSTREPHSRNGGNPSSVVIRHQHGAEAYTNPRELFFNVNLEPEQPENDSRSFQAGNRSQSELESSNSVGVLIRKNLNVDIAELTGSRIGYLECNNQSFILSNYCSLH